MGQKGTEDVLLKVYMHCEGCADQVSSCLKGFDGVVEVEADIANNKVIVKGQNVDPLAILNRIRRKFSRNAELISPKPKPAPVDNAKKQPETKKELQIKTVVLKMNMHCGGCAEEIETIINRMQGILRVETSMEKSLVTVQGDFDAQKVAEKLRKRTRKHVEIIKQELHKEKKKEPSNKKENIINEIQYPPPPPQISRCNIDPSHVFSDDNVFSCSIM